MVWIADHTYLFEQAKNVMANDGQHDEITNCAICLENYENDNLVLLLECRHIFHEHCGVQWFRGQQFCPMCRAKQQNKPSTFRQLVTNDAVDL